jgi:radical SAM protein with 4Fe4S-binding SPASM domain
VSTPEPRCADEADLGARGATGYEIIGQIQTWASDNIVPLNAAIEITLKCNIRCLHCYNFDRDEAKPACDKPEMSTEQILGLMADLRAAGCLFLMFTGGEVLSDPRLFTFLDRARELNFAVQVLTNGTMLQPGIAARLASYGNLQGVSVSLYGATAEVHDGVTQMSGSWRRTWEGVERLRKLGVIVRLKYIIMRQNAHEVAAMRAQATDRGYAYIMDVNITTRHDGDRTSLDTRITLEQLETLYRGALSNLVRTDPRPISEEDFYCNCARSNVAITSTGNVQPCMSVPWIAGNVHETPFAEIWKSSPVFQRIRGLKMADYAKCAPCGDKDYCRRDRGVAYTSTGDYTSADPFTCATADLNHRLSDERAAERATGVAAPRGPEVPPRAEPLVNISLRRVAAAR